MRQDAPHIDEEALARSLGDLQAPDGDDVAVQAGIERVIHGAGTVFAGSGVGLMLIGEDGHSLRYVASSDDVARQLEFAHEEAGEGPCIDAFVLDAESRRTTCWSSRAGRPASRAARPADPRGPRLPTRLGTPVGTLNLYCDRPRVWDESEITALEAYNHLLEARLAKHCWLAGTARSSTSCR